MTPHDPNELRAQLEGRRVVASISGGKDSAAMSLYLTDLGIEHDRVFLDTGWEADKTYAYLRGPLQDKLGPITEVRAPHQMVHLILRKGMFSSRQQRFCTQELKIFPMIKHLNGVIDAGEDPVNAVGIRRAESAARSRMPEWETSKGFPCETWRPLIHWSEQDVIDMHTRHGLAPNPLYLEGATRVGCWPCVFARKSEIRHIADVDPARIDLMRRLEERVTARAAKRYAAKGETFKSLGYVEPSWFQDPMPAKRPCETCGGTGLGTEEAASEDEDRQTEPCKTCNGRGTRRCGEPWPIDKVVTWARTSRGGRQLEMFAPPEREQGCMRWGLCDHGSEADSGTQASKTQRAV